MDDGDLVLLMECSNSTEAAGIRSVLEAHGIGAFIQGEHHSYFVGPLGAAFIQPRVFVGQGDVERARAVLTAESVHTTTGVPLEGGICAVHEAQAISTCSRCGNFLCAECKSLGEPPVCESCLEAERVPPPPPPSSSSFMIFLAVLVATVGFVLFLGFLR